MARHDLRETTRFCKILQNKYPKDAGSAPYACFEKSKGIWVFVKKDRTGNSSDVTIGHGYHLNRLLGTLVIEVSDEALMDELVPLADSYERANPAITAVQLLLVNSDDGQYLR